MNISSFVSKLNLQDDWENFLKTNSLESLEKIIIGVVNDFVDRGKAITCPYRPQELLLSCPELDFLIYEDLFKVADPRIALKSSIQIVKDFGYEGSLSFEQRLERMAWLFGIQNLDKMLSYSEGTLLNLSCPSNYETCLIALDRALTKKSLTECLLSNSRFVRERRLFLEEKR